VTRHTPGSTPSSADLVLVVEDEMLARMDAIETAGFDVIEATDVDKAIAILEQRSDIAGVAFGCFVSKSTPKASRRGRPKMDWPNQPMSAFRGNPEEICSD
jgi:hypothetical protein